MRRLSTVLAILGLAAFGLAAPAQAAPQGVGCGAEWHGRDGTVRAWQHYDCGGIELGSSTGNDASWADGVGFEVTRFAADWASSVMNSGFIGGRDVVAFYPEAGFGGTRAACLSPNELYADNLTDNYYPGTQLVVNDRIRSHAWTTADACAAGSWLS
ncbi:hypothetical protein HA039_20770 [Streptomyces liangshanensis]|uniref:Secreted protein n=2 Tax=Streptomyces liangshanensis TaxID=2717324 RepID=A0A6G9H919_9ACTN|nr:hypothetical protein HA039_20770 [Streptomyces liangshanensis]